MGLDSGILKEFAIEANELLDEAEDALLKIEHSEDLKTIYDKVFRAFHSLKGSSGMMGFETLQRHLHLLEDFLQKSKSDFKHFKNSTDYYLRGIDAARKILNGDIISFVYEIYSKTSYNDIELTKSKRKKISYLATSKTPPLAKEFFALENELGFVLKIISHLTNESYDILISDLNTKDLQEVISGNKSKIPLIHILENIKNESLQSNVFQLLSNADEKNRVYYTLQSAIIASNNIELFDRAKGLLMYMYSDLEELLISKNKEDTQKILSTEIKSFIATYTSK